MYKMECDVSIFTENSSLTFTWHEILLEPEALIYNY